MGNVIKLSDYMCEEDKWKEVFAANGCNSTLQVYANASLGEVEIVQMNDDDESIRTLLSFDEAVELFNALGAVPGLKKRAVTE